MQVKNTILLFCSVCLYIFPITFGALNGAAGNRTTFDWNSFQKLDFDGDKQDEIVLASEGRTGILKLEKDPNSVGDRKHTDTTAHSKKTPNRWHFTVPVTASNNCFSTWESMREKIGPTGDFDGDGKTEMFMVQGNGFSLIQAENDSIIVKSRLHSGAEKIGSRLFSRLIDLLGPVGDFDGDGKDEILLLTDMMEVDMIKLVENQFVIAAVAGMETSFAGWRMKCWSESFGPVGDFDGDGKAEVIVSSEWGIVMLKVNGNKISPVMGVPNGTLFGGKWLFDSRVNRIGPAADFDGDGKTEILITSKDEIGILKASGNTFTLMVKAPDRTYLGDWHLRIAENSFGPVGDFDGDGRAEVLVKSNRSLGILKLADDRLVSFVNVQNGERFGGSWTFNASDDRIGPVGDFDGDGKDEIAIASGWGTAIIKPDGKAFSALATAANGTLCGTWPLFTYNFRYGQADFVPFPATATVDRTLHGAIHDPDVLYGCYRNNLIRRHFTSEGMVGKRVWEIAPYVPEFSLNWNLERYRDNLDRKSLCLSPDSCQMRLTGLSKLKSKTPEFTWRGCNDDLMLSGVALALFSMEAEDLGTFSSIGYSQNIFKHLQFSRFPNSGAMFVKKETIVSADEFVGICFGLYWYHRMCVKYKFTDEKFYVEKLAKEIATCLSGHGYWVLPWFADIADVPRFTTKMTSDKKWWTRQSALPYVYPLQLMFGEMLGSKTDLKWAPEEYELYLHGTVGDKTLFADSGDCAAFIAATKAGMDGIASLSARPYIQFPPNSGNSYRSQFALSGAEDTVAGIGKRVNLTYDSPFVFNTLLGIIEKCVTVNSKQPIISSDAALPRRGLTGHLSLPVFESRVKSNLQHMLQAVTTATNTETEPDSIESDRQYLLTALCAVVVVENGNLSTDALGGLFGALIRTGHTNSLIAAIADKCAKDDGSKKKSKSAVRFPSIVAKGQHTGNSTRAVDSTVHPENLLNGTSATWVVRRKTVSEALDGDTNWIELLASAFADDTLKRLFTGENAEATAVEIMNEYTTGAAIDMSKTADHGLGFLLYRALLHHWRLSSTPLRILPRFDRNPEQSIDNLIPALHFESEKVQKSYRGL